MAAPMKSFRLLCRMLKSINTQPSNSFCCTKLCNDNIKTLKIMHTVEELPPKETFPDYEISTEEFKYVEKLLPKNRIPDPPAHASYPTPSGWVPPNKEKTKDLPYSVERNRNHNLPVYIRQVALRGSKITTVINGVHGDIWQFEQDLRDHVESTLEMSMPLLTEVSEVTRRVTLKGDKVEVVGKWLLDRGF